MSLIIIKNISDFQINLRARIAQNNDKNKKNLNFLNNASRDDFSNDSMPTLVVTSDQVFYKCYVSLLINEFKDKFGYVIALNVAAATLFGYNKTEVLNRKINVLMPNIFSKNHDSFIEHYLAIYNNEIKNVTKDRILFGKTRSNYIFPFYLTIKVPQSFINKIFLYF